MRISLLNCGLIHALCNWYYKISIRVIIDCNTISSKFYIKDRDVVRASKVYTYMHLRKFATVYMCV